MKEWLVYLLKCADNTLYCGITNNLDVRLKAHNEGKGAKYTRGRRPLQLVASSGKMTKSEALKHEIVIKKLPAGKKILALNNRLPGNRYD